MRYIAQRTIDDRCPLLPAIDGATTTTTATITTATTTTHASLLATIATATPIVRARLSRWRVCSAHLTEGATAQTARTEPSKHTRRGEPLA